jgi:glycerol-3-phosphate dehydrogenase
LPAEATAGRPFTLADGDYDVVVVGGGMAGAGAARDLALRGLSVALVEKGDFASATTARSSKLIHGGLRYLELFDFGLVRESLRERERLGRLAPHLVKPLPFLVPIYRDSSRGLVKVRIGLTLYDWLTPGRTRERYRVLKAVDALSLEPSIRPDDLRGAGYYFDDLLLYPERLCLENVLSACRHGARAFNYAQVEEVRRAGGGVPDGLRVRDLLTGGVVTLGAKVIVNATGPWVDELRALAGVHDRGARVLRRTKGIHCLLPRLTERAIYHSTSDDRMIFVIPWREFSLVGTTDTDFDGDLDRVHATRNEVEYLLGEVRHAVPDPRVVPAEVLYTYAGVRPLSFEEGRRASDVSRAHKVVEEAGGRFLSITGTKLTCFRSLAEELGDRVSRRLGRPAPSRTARLTLDGADEEVGRVEAHTWLDVSADVAASGLPRETLETLVSLYGRNYRRVMELAGKVTGGTERLCPSNPDVVAQLHHAVHEELTVSLQDFLLRRTGIGTSRCQGGDCAEAIGRRLAPLLGWSGRRLDAELEAFGAHVARSQRFRA